MPHPVRVSLSDVKRMLRDRPVKFSADQVAYRPGKGKERCGNCAHFFRSKQRAVCEILRLAGDTQTSDESIMAGWTCDYFTPDGVSYPLSGKE
jgi:hypothetical protein